jgi:hypothetical protein
MSKVYVVGALAVDETDCSYYPYLPKENSRERGLSYLQCLVVMFATLRRVYPDFIPLCIINDRTYIPDAILAVFRRLDVTIVEIPFLSKGVAKTTTFQSTFYKYDVMDYISKRDSRDFYIMVDADVVWHARNLDLDLYIAERIPIAYLPREKTFTAIKLTIYKKFKDLNLPLPRAFDWYGGEFLAGTPVHFEKIGCILQQWWPYIAEKKPQDITEELVMSYALNTIRNELGLVMADFIIERYLTKTPTAFDYQVLKFCSVWHLPAEKKDGFKRFFTLLEDGIDLHQLDDKAYSQLLLQIFCSQKQWRW